MKEKTQGGSRENAGRKKTQNVRIFLTVSKDTEEALGKFKERWQTTFPKSKTGYVAEIDSRLNLLLKTDAIELSKMLTKQEKATPIPITEDFLISLGFEKREGLMSWSYFSNGRIELSMHSTSNEYRFTLYNGKTKIFRYCHQIENLVSLLK